MSDSLDMLRAVVKAAEDKAWRCAIEVTNAQRRLDEAEGHFPTWSCAAARVVAVYQRAVLLTWTQRRELQRLWTGADEAAAAGRVFADHGPGWRVRP